jgi:hypothetical protein
MSANQIKFPIVLGIPCIAVPATTTLALNTAASAAYLAFSFTLDTAKTVNSIRAYVSAMTGTLAANDVTAEIQTDSADNPSGTNPSGGAAQSANGTPGVGWIEFDGFTASLSAATQYWIVLKNPATTSGSPTTVYPTYQWISGVVSPGVAPGVNSTLFTWYKKQSTNSGSSWTSLVNQAAGWTLIYSDGTWEGLPISAYAQNSTDKAYNTGSASFEVGSKFTSPANAFLNVRAVSISAGTSSGVGPLVAKLYLGASGSTCTLAAKTGSMTSLSGNASIGYFTGDVVIPPATVCRLVLADTSSTGSTSKYFAPSEFTFDPAAPTTLLPFDGSMVKTVTVNGTSTVGNSPGSAFTDSSIGTLMQMALLLDTNGEFAGGPIGQCTGGRMIGAF